MKCDIIKDLLPLYCDDVLSEASREEVEKHIAECADCLKTYEEMKSGDIKLNKMQKNIEPMKKVKKKFWLTVSLPVILIAAMLLFSAYELLCAHPMLPNSKDISYETDISYNFDIYSYFDDIEGKSKEIAIDKGSDIKIDEFSNVVLVNGEKLLDEYHNPVPATGTVFPSGQLRFYIKTETNMPCTKQIIHDNSKYPLFSLSLELRPCLPFRQDMTNGEISEEPGIVLTAPLNSSEGSTITIRCRDKDIVLDVYEIVKDKNKLLDESSD